MELKISPVTLLLVSEIGGKAFPIARISDSNLIRVAGEAAIREKRHSARKSQGTLNRRLLREASDLEQIIDGQLGMKVTA